MEPSGFSQPQGISPDGEIMQPPLVAEVLVAVPPPLFGAQAQQSPERAPLAEHDRLGPQRHAGSAQGSPQHPISHDDGHRPLSSQVMRPIIRLIVVLVMWDYRAHARVRFH